MTIDETLALSWSGGKDSALALRALEQEGGRPAALITTVTDQYDRISMHGVRRALLVRQAEALGIELVEIRIPAGCSNDVYERSVERAFASATLAGVGTVAYGDLFLADIRRYREEHLATMGRRAVFPVWGRETDELAREFVAAGFEATIVCVDPAKLDASFAGRAYDDALLDDLPAGVDPCGENGEFHTFVHGGPLWTSPIACRVGETVERGGFVFCDLVVAD